MNRNRLPSRLALTLFSTLVPLCAQTPLFTDGTAFGGSKVFSTGCNPMGNPARFSQPLPGCYFTYLTGDQRAQDNKSLLQNASAQDPATLASLQGAPWAERTRAYGIAGLKDGTSLAFTRENLNSLMAFPDVDPTHLGAANATTVLGRRATVNRLSFGGSQTQSGTSFGGSLRIEQWENGTQTAALNPAFSQVSMTNLDDVLLGNSTTTAKTLSYSVAAGFLTELAQGLRLGVTADQLNPKRLWDVYQQPQFRAGLQFDVGAMTKLSVEADINAAARMPFPEKQQTVSASLTLAASSSVSLILGAERRNIGDVTNTLGGITLQLRTASFLLGVGFQFGQSNPLRGATLMVN